MENYLLGGELKRRIELSDSRLSAEEYTYPKALIGDPKWAGDWQGRSILAQFSLYKAGSKGALDRLENLINGLTEYINKDGYFGEIFDRTILKEQQVSGNSWFLRAICEYYSAFKNEQIKNLIAKIVKNFLLPTKNFYENYPTKKREVGEISGKETGQIINGWQLSTDTGCAFIMLDGATAAYEITKSLELKELIKVMIKSFSTIDYKKAECQTHAYLSALRGIYRFFVLTNDKKYLDFVVNGFEFYCNNGMTINYANFNWFNRLDTWTEPCAVTDSLLLADSLYVETSEPKYLKILHRIYYNAICSAQRSNGGAGCDLILSQNNDYLNIIRYEANFCCTMRINEVWRRLYELCKPKIDKDTLVLNFITDLSCDKVIINIVDNVVYFKILDEQIKQVLIYCDEQTNTQNCFKIIKVENGSAIYKTNSSVHSQTIMGKTVYFVGDKLLTKKIKGNFNHYKHYKINGEDYSYVADFSQMLSKEEELAVIQKI